ncbi:MAG TPA: hypothetical protein VHU77_12765, partial [Candidatus Limnocylindria bacterium]|nr:hypothetical protein [Candidatus Limnocylindria bacterium]
MRDVARTAPTARLRPAAGLAILALLAGTLLTERPAVLGARPGGLAADAATFLAGRDGGNASDYRLLYQRTALAPDGRQLWTGKLLDRRTGEVRLVYSDGEGRTGGPELLTGLQRAADGRLTALQRKASAPLRASLAASAPGARAKTLPVAIWLEVDTGAALRAVEARHPEVRWIGGRPVAGDLRTVRRLRAELWNARRDAYAAATAPLRTQVEELGGRIAYASSSAPLVFTDL